LSVIHPPRIAVPCVSPTLFVQGAAMVGQGEGHAMLTDLTTPTIVQALYGD